MPIDFARVPPKVVVPEAPRLSRLPWTVLFVAVMSAGSALGIFLWPPSRPTDTFWFWFCVIGYPALAWAFLVCWRLGWLYGQRGAARAINGVSDRELATCHARASEPLALLGHAWCFSSAPQENEVRGILDGTLSLQPRGSVVEADIKVTARWLEIPEQPLCAGNVLDEQKRHMKTFAWLMSQLLDTLTPSLRALTVAASLRVTLSLNAVLDAQTARQRTHDMLDELNLRVADMTVDATSDPVSLFQVDAWLDEEAEANANAKSNAAHLLIAIQLRPALSEVLEAGVAEAGVALLFGRASRAHALTGEPALRVHRPAKGAQDTVGETLDCAQRWGLSLPSLTGGAWTSAISSEFEGVIRSLPAFDPTTRLIRLDATVGDCGVASGWLAVALAARQALNSGEPQQVIARENEELIALTCRTQT